MKRLAVPMGSVVGIKKISQSPENWIGGAAWRPDFSHTRIKILDFKHLRYFCIPSRPHAQGDGLGKISQMWESETCVNNAWNNYALFLWSNSYLHHKGVMRLFRPADFFPPEAVGRGREKIQGRKAAYSRVMYITLSANFLNHNFSSMKLPPQKNAQQVEFHFSLCYKA